MSKPRKKGVDMSLPPEDRRRRREQGPVGGTPPAQLGHAQGSRAARWTRDGQRKLAAMEVLHGNAYHDAVLDCLDDEAAFSRVLDSIGEGPDA